MHALRDYQEAIVNKVISLVAQGKSCTFQLPTGLGKSRILLEIVLRTIADPRKKVLLIFHSEQLLQQMSDDLYDAGQGHTFIIAQSNISEQPEDSITLAMSQTLSRRIKKELLRHVRYDLILIDEIHRLLMQHKAAADYWNVPIVGATATPTRFDKKSIGEVTPILIQGIQIKEGIQRGLLAPVRSHPLPSPDLKSITVRAGEYVPEDVEREFFLANIQNTIVYWWELLAISSSWTQELEDELRRKTQRAVNAVHEEADEEAIQQRVKALSTARELKEVRGIKKHRRTMIFAPSINTSKAIAESFFNKGYLFVHIDKSSSQETKTIALKALAEHKIDGIVNVGIYIEGLNLVEIDCIVDAAPTLSLAKALQKPGRGLRTAKNKKDLLFLDFAGCERTHGPIEASRDWANDGEIIEDISNMRQCKNCRARVLATNYSCPVCGNTSTLLEIFDGFTAQRQATALSIATAARACPLSVKKEGLEVAWNLIEQERVAAGFPLEFTENKLAIVRKAVARKLKQSNAAA